MILDLNLENYQRMVQASIKRAGEYTWEKTAYETLAAYKQLYSQIPKAKITESFVEDIDLNQREPIQIETKEEPEVAVSTEVTDDMIEEDEKSSNIRES